MTNHLGELRVNLIKSLKDFQFTCNNSLEKISNKSTLNS